MSEIRLLADWAMTADDERLAAEVWPSGTEVLVGPKLTDRERFEALKRIDVLVGYGGSITSELLEPALNLRLAHTLGHGIDALLQPPIPQLLMRRGVRLATASTSGPGIAEFVIMNMIALGRQLITMHNSLAMEGEWRPVTGVPELRGATLCVIGLGSIGMDVVRLGQAMGMQTIGVTRHPSRHEGADQGPAKLYGYQDINEALNLADYVVLCAPLTVETDGLLNADRLRAMKDGGFLINVARGELVNETDLFQALASGRLAGAAIDAWWGDRTHRSVPIGYPSSHPLHAFNVIMTPHCAGVTAARMRRALTLVGQNLTRLLAGDSLINEVSAETMLAMVADEAK